MHPLAVRARGLGFGGGMGVAGAGAATVPEPVWAWRASDLSLAPYVGSGTPTLTRAGNTATRVNSSGLIETVNADLPRFDYSFTSVGTLLGLLVEEARTNVVLHNRDMSNAAWTKGATMTAAKDQTGVDGSANSASSLTGGAVTATNTVLQSITLASSARFQTAYVKRLVGTGTIEMTMDNGSTWTDVTSQISTSWARISIASQTIADPVVGFRITTSGDKIAVDFFQNENGAFATSAIPTAGATVTRAADVITLATASIPGFSATTLTMYAEAYGPPPQTAVIFQLDDGTASNRHFLQATTTSTLLRHNITASAAAEAVLNTLATWTQGALFKLAGAGASNDAAASGNGLTAVTDTSVTLPVGMANLRIGRGSTGDAMNAPIRKLRLYNVRKSNAQLEAMTQ